MDGKKIILGCLYFIFNVLNENGILTKTKIYQIFKYPPKNESSFGFVRINKELSDGEFLSYYDPQFQTTSIISNFYDSEYECTGSCHCEEENRRNSASFINRGLFAMISALSVSMAINIAKETFENNCKESNVGLCAEKNVKSEVGNCEKLNEISKTEGNDIEYKDSKQRRIYSCYGHCVPNTKHLFWDTSEVDVLRSSPNLKEVRKAFGDCSRLETTADIELEIDYTPKDIQTSNKEAQNRFRIEYLGEFCRTQSMIDVKVVTNKDVDLHEYKTSGKKVRYFKDIKSQACVATDRSNHDKNIKCKLIGKRILDLESNPYYY